MVGIVVVSHSYQLAKAAVALSSEMTHGRPLQIEIAAGLDEHTFGTDAIAVQEAIEKVAADDGVLVLMDLGSAVLSAELALDLIDPETAAKVRLCSAPLVEGLVAATVAAAGGASIEEVEAEAVAGLAGKQSHLGIGDSPREQETAVADAVTGTFVIENAHGLHARPAARLVAEVRTLDAKVRLRNVTTDSPSIPGSSLTRIATLGALKGHTIEISATGSQAKQAVEHVLALAARRFGEDERESTPQVQAPRGAGPQPASPGIGTGPAWLITGDDVDLSSITATADDPAAEWRRVRSAVAETRHAISQSRGAAARHLGDAEAAVFDAHLMLLEDAELLDAVHERIDKGVAAPHAWAEVFAEAAAEFEHLPDEYQRARAADVTAVRGQVLATMLGKAHRFTARPGVLVAADLTPGQAAALDRDVVTGIVLAHGSPTSHAAILARSLGIPAVVGAGPEVLTTPPGTVIALDGGTGALHIAPSESVLADLHARLEEQQIQSKEALDKAAEPAVTIDGVAIDVAANLGKAADAATAVENGVDLAGLIRTEFLFLDRDVAPSEDEQYETYLAIAQGLAGRRGVFRTLDVGGDKPLRYVAQPHEDNPFLGLRGIRLALAQPDLLDTQLRAILRVAREYPVSIMFPMVTALDELLAALGHVRRACEGTLPETLELGMMIEVPSAALKAAVFAPHVDFFSIGTNDLTQYTLAAERGNESVSQLFDPLDPGVLRLIAEVSTAAAGQARVGVCGEAASDLSAIPILLGLGVQELSVSPYAIPTVKDAVRKADTSVCSELATEATLLATAREVRALVANAELQVQR